MSCAPVRSKILEAFKAILRFLWKAVYLEHDPIWGCTLVGQWCVSGQEPSASAWPCCKTVNAREHWQGPTVIISLFLLKWHSRLLFTRIGATWSFGWWKYFQKNQRPPPPGHHDHFANTGVFIIRPGYHSISWKYNLPTEHGTNSSVLLIINAL